jgi:hypothetical protein
MSHVSFDKYIHNALTENKFSIVFDLFYVKGSERVPKSTQFSSSSFDPNEASESWHFQKWCKNAHECHMECKGIWVCIGSSYAFGVSRGTGFEQRGSCSVQVYHFISKYFGSTRIAKIEIILATIFFYIIVFSESSFFNLPPSEIPQHLKWYLYRAKKCGKCLQLKLRYRFRITPDFGSHLAEQVTADGSSRAMMFNVKTAMCMDCQIKLIVEHVRI